MTYNVQLEIVAEMSPGEGDQESFETQSIKALFENRFSSPRYTYSLLHIDGGIKSIVVKSIERNLT